MATISQVQEVVYRARFEDQASAGAAAAAKAVDGYNAALEVVDQTVTRSTRTATSLIGQYDQQTKAAKALETAKRNLAAAENALAAETATGGSKQEALARTVDVLRDKVAAGSKALGDGAEAVKKTGDAHGAAAQKVGLFGLDVQRTGFLLHDATKAIESLTLGMSPLMVAMQHVGQLQGLFGDLGTAAKAFAASALTVPGVLLGVVAGMAAVGIAANSNANRLSDLRESLRLTHTDYAALAVQVDTTARRIAASSNLTRSGAEDIAKGIASSKYLGEFAGSLDQLTRSAADFSRVAGVDGAQAGKTYRLAIDDASAAVKQLAELGLPSFNAELVRNVQRLDASGQHADATRAIFKALDKDLSGAKDDTSELSKAFTQLSNSLTGTHNGVQGLGDAFNSILADTIRSTAHDIENIVAIAQKAYDLAMKAKGLLTAGPLVDTNTGQTPNVSADLLRVAPDITNKIYSIAQANNISPQIADLATRIAYVESRGQQIDPRTGRTLTSSAGALGVMQLMPSTAAGADINPGGTLNPNSLDDNILLGLRKIAAIGADPRFPTEADIAGAYNAGEAGYARARAAGVLPSETAKYIPAVTGQPLAPGAAITVSSGAAVLPDSVRKILDPLGGKDGTQLANAQDAADRIADITRAIIDLRGAGETTGPTMDRLQALLGKAREAAYGAVPAFDGTTRASKDSLVPLQAQAGAARTVAEAVNQARIALSAHGQDLSDVQASEVRTDALKKLGVQFDDNVAKIDREIAAQARVNAVYAAAGGSILEITARTKAEADARETAIPGTAEYARQVEILTTKNLGLANSQTALQQIQQNKGLENNIALIQAEANTLGMSTDERTRALAVMKAEQDQHAKYGPLLSEEQQRYVDLIGKQADYTAALNHQKGALQELSGFFTNTFDIISNAITQAFATGNLAALKFKDIAKSVASAVISEFAKLAILNPLKNWLFGGNDQTLSSVTGVIGNLFGGGTGGSASTGGSAFDTALPAVAAVASTVQAGSATASLFGQPGTTLAAGGTAATSAGGVGGIVSNGGTLLSGGISKLIEGGISGGLQSIGSYIASGITSLAGNAATATNLALGAAGEGISGVATASQVAGASLADAAGASASAAQFAASAAGQVAAAIPYIGIAVSLVSDLIQGNFRGAALVATGAALGGAIGTFVFPAVGTAVGAVVGAALGGLADAFFPAHPLHPFDASNLDVQGGRLVQGKTLSQAETAQAGSVVDLFATNMNVAMDRLGLVLTNLDGTIGAVGNGIQGLATVNSPAALFNRLQFANAPGDTSQFGVAKGALAGMRFETPQALTDELAKIAGFADATEAIGIQLKSVSTDLTNIQIAGVSGGGQGNDLRTALSHDLTTQTFANVAALDAEINKVNQFVNGTIPGLLHPVEQTTSAIVDQANKVMEAYQSAVDQSIQYGLDNTQVLRAAEEQALAIVRRSGIEQIQANQTLIADRLKAATGGPSGQDALDNFDIQAQQQRNALSKLWTDTYGDMIKTSTGYLQSINALETTLGAERVRIVEQTWAQFNSQVRSISDTVTGYSVRLATAQGGPNTAAGLVGFDTKALQERQAFIDQWDATFGKALESAKYFQDALVLIDTTHNAERLAIAKQAAQQVAAAVQGIADADLSFWARIAAARGDQKTSDLINFDVKAGQERTSFSAQLLSTYGASFQATQAYANQMALLEQALGAERLAIVQKYGTGITAATAAQLQQAHTSVATLFTSLTDYVIKLQTGTSSPLSPTKQYDLAKSQFNAVAGAAAAGDATSAGKLTGFSDTFLGASRAIYGSGTGYATDFNRVLNAIQNVVQAPVEPLTNSFLAIQLQQQTTSIVQAQQATTDAINALRREFQQQQRAAA